MSNTKLAIPLYYEIYMQDLAHEYIDLKPLGIARTVEEARTCCNLFREAINTSQERGIGDLRSRCTVIFRPVLKGGEQG